MEDVLIHELSAGYALDALDAEDTQSFENHLTSCPDCRQDVATFAEVASLLAFAVPSVDVPLGLKGRVLDAVAEPKRVVPLRPRRRSLALAAVAAAACVAVVFAAWTIAVGSSGDGQQRTLPLVGATGSVVLAHNGEATLVVDGLSRAPSGKTYEAWVIRGPTTRAAGTFTSSAASRPFQLTRTLNPGWHVAVTLEPAGGSPRPTGQLLFRSHSA
jgi:anti-sigma-K factor RskA